jgi:hypothetical protein
VARQRTTRSGWHLPSEHFAFLLNRPFKEEKQGNIRFAPKTNLPTLEGKIIAYCALWLELGTIMFLEFPSSAMGGVRSNKSTFLG